MREPAAWWDEGRPASRLLAPLAALYDLVATRRLTLGGARAPVPVVCVGNPTVGGAGKTPTAIAIARMLQAAGRKPAFLSRGYGGGERGPVVVSSAHDAAAVGDEPLLLARVAPTVVARDRVAGARAAAAAGADVGVMDDGFQNPALAKDFSLLVVDGSRGLGNGRVVPAGPLRAGLDAQMARAQALVVVGECSRRAAPAVAAARAREMPVWQARLVPDPAAAAALSGQRVLAFAGIGDPARFFAMLEGLGLALADRASFPDHHRFAATEAADLLARAARANAVPVTTEKDHVRLAGAPAAAELARRARPLPVTIVFDQEVAVRERLLAAIGEPA